MAKIVAPPEQVEETLKHFQIDAAVLEPNEAEAKVNATPEDAEPDLSEEEAATLYEEAAAIDSAIEKLTERREQIKATYRRLPYGTTTVHAEVGGKVTIGHNPIFSELRMFDKYPYDYMVIEDQVVTNEVTGKKKIVPTQTFPNRPLYKIAPDRAAMKRILSEEDYKALFDEGDKKVTIK